MEVDPFLQSERTPRRDMSTSFRHQLPQRSPTSSSSEQTSTPTSPHFAQAQQAYPARATTVNRQAYSRPLDQMQTSQHHRTHSRLQSQSHEANGTGRPNGNGVYAGPSHYPTASSSASIAPSHTRSMSSQAFNRAPTPEVLVPPSGQSFSQHLKSWTNGEMSAWLGTFKCAHLAPLFQQNDIDGKVLLDLDMASLKEMGVPKVGERVKILTAVKELRKRAAGVPVASSSASPRVADMRMFHQAAAAGPSSTGDSGLRQPTLGPGMANRRQYNTRPPPLDLQHHSSRNLPQAYQAPLSSDRQTTPKALHHPSHGQPAHQSRPSITSQTGSTTAAPSAASLSSSTASSVPAPSRPANLNLRAPPARDSGRRTPSPINPDVANFLDRPLPPAPSAHQSHSSSAAEYAHSVTQSRGPPGGLSLANGGAQGASLAERRALPQPGPVQLARPDHRRAPSINVVSPPPGYSQVSPTKARGMPLRQGSAQSVHPFAASSSRVDEASPPRHSPYIEQAAPSSSSSGHLRSGSNAYPVPPKSGQSGPMSLEDLRRQLVKFVNAEDGTMKTVNVSSCVSGVEVLERVLKKFGKWNPALVGTDTESDEDGERLEVDGWGVYDDEADLDGRPLSESALLGICLAHREGTAIRDKGLILKRTRKFGSRKNMDHFLGEAIPPPMSPTSPVTYFNGPRLGVSQNPPSHDLLTPRPPPGGSPANAAMKKMNRASTVSVMSGLGVPMPDLPPSPSTARSPGSSFLPSRKKMYNFFGHRPPSELISSHLLEYFPSAKRKELEKTVKRNSTMRMSMYNGPGGPSANKRASLAPSLFQPEQAKPSPPRRTGRPVSRATMSSSPPDGAIPEEGEEVIAVPRLSISNDRGSSGAEDGRGTDDDDDNDDLVASYSQPPLLPPFQPSGESLSDSLQAYSPNSLGTGTEAKPRPKSVRSRRSSIGSSRSRKSMISHRAARDKSDTASMLTVDEITAEVEQRRVSTITFDESEQEEAAAPQRPLSVRIRSSNTGVPTSESELDAEDEEEDDDEEEEEESSEAEDEDEEDDEDDEEDGATDEQGKAFTSTGSKRIIKWIKGALIGAGSFGSVYLGMDAHSGLLMAVKQVELPTGSARNEERKKGMVDALEREIELLKELQHENIVQYLDSSADGHHLNIFLEYVPGGSVAALLNNYGAFEEALVRNFVRQILMGLNYLHQREIIHRDIKGANILVDNKGGIKISDFGISKKVESNLMQSMRTNRPSLQGSVFWMAPEVVKQTSYTLKADIWSVGCLVVEMLTGTHPWADLTQMQAIFKIGSSARPAMPVDISRDAEDFLNKTFELDHNARPMAGELLVHAFIAPPPTSAAPATISEAQAKASMAAAHASAQKGMMAMGRA